MAEELKLEVGSNLDEVLKKVRELKKENEKLSSSYKTLQQSVSSNGRVLQQNLSSLNKTQEFVQQYNNAIDEMKRKNDEAWSNGVTKIKEYNTAYQKLVQTAASSSLRLASSVARTSASMSPISPTEFSGGFSVNPATMFGFGDAIKSAFSLMKELQQMRHDLAYLSNTAGDASQAVNTVFSIASGSAISRGTATGVVRALADQGLQLYDTAGKVSPRIRNLGVLAGNLQAATGIAASQWGAFTGELSYNYGVTEEGLASLTSTLVGTGLNAQNLERTLSTINKVLQNTAFVAGVPTEKAVLGLTRTVGGAAKVFQKLQISAEKASTFIEGVLDPENYEKNALMFAKLGISASEYAGYLNSVNGQQLLLERVMGNLPQLASQIASIRNPFARLEIGKQLGLDSQMVQRFANASKEEIESIMKEFAAANKNQEALQAKKKRMAAESAKFDDYIFALRMQVLQPVMKMLSEGTLQKFMGVLPSLASSMAKIFEAVTPLAVVFADAFVKAVPYVTNFATGVSKAISYIFGEEGLDVAGKGLEGVVRDSANYVSSKYEGLGVNFGGILSVLSKIYLAVKAFQLATFFVNTAKTLGGFVGAGIDKVLGWINPRQKLVMNATVGDLADAIKTANSPTGGVTALGGLREILGGAFLALGSMGIGSLIFKLLFGSQSFKEFENLANYASETGMSRVNAEKNRNLGLSIGERGFMTGTAGAVLGGKFAYNTTNVAIKAAQEAVALESARVAAMEQTLATSQIQTISKTAFKGAFGKEAAKTFGAKVAAPLAVALTGFDIYKFFTSEKTGLAYGLQATGTALNTAGTYGLVSSGLASLTGIGALPGAAGATASTVMIGAGTVLNFLADYFQADKEVQERRAGFNKLYNEQTRELLQADQETIAQQFEAYGSMFGGKTTLTLNKVSALNYENFLEYEKAIKAQKESVLESNTFKKSIADTKGAKNFIDQTYNVGEEEFLKRRLALATVSNDLEVIEAKREELKQFYIKEKMSNIEAEEKVNKAIGENLDETKKQILDRKVFFKEEINGVGKIFNSLYTAFKIGDFESIGKVLQEVFYQFKVGFLKMYSSIPGLTTQSAINLARSVGLTVDESLEKNFLGTMADSKEWMKYLEGVTVDSEKRLSGIIDKISENSKKQSEVEKQKADMAKANQEAALKSQQKLTTAVDNNTKATQEANNKNLTVSERITTTSNHWSTFYAMQ